MTITHPSQGVRDAGMAASPVELDVRRLLREAREELREVHEELDARREQETALREHLEDLAVQAGAAEVWRARYTELHVAYVELLTRARAEVAKARADTPFRVCHLVSHLEKVGLMPAEGATPDQLMAEGLALAASLAKPKTSTAEAVSKS
ncbi:hypothetical protein ACGFNU_11315 [Spirillospora sp. NPDC048911]|uniref:hypothetical protein n=1 Tax=Spirillospora sp. NPDC048911 TaxID=3364527 RepID=UPI003714A49F